MHKVYIMFTIIPPIPLPPRGWFRNGSDSTKNRTDVFSLEPEYPSEPKKKFYHIVFDRETKGDVNPYQLKTGIEDTFEEKVEKLTTDSQNCFSFQVKITESTEQLVNVTKCGEINCRLSPHKYLNQIKGILYIYEYEFNEQFKKDLMEEYSFIDDVTDAPFMKPRN